MESVITIGKNYTNVTAKDHHREAKVRERLTMYRSIGLSNEAIIHRTKTYHTRYEYAKSSYAYAGEGYIDECGVMAEVYRVLAEERGLV